LIGQFV